MYDLSAASEISITKLSLIERGIFEPTQKDKIKLAELYGLAIVELFPDSKEPPWRAANA